ncbi:hypothetical protein COY87_03170 [Candidatus Roizmanbacteria bacterium CG_4_10_14_0_8_um_filter_33_9]|uniref:Uncharacterized protein n=1 Tax=Candidatus Roizmanbacteria bacterium CG_4_10_14_0_8_um_filter_33_9 TaxID=1974826 RepID=A0A2M7QI58_9BACT|nr:MAG: hypothetical protein COY87_03170 [Candidatus Roizmanbacteria bacterium CG_4_10_14_0_8_um_filter_33_9]
MTLTAVTFYIRKFAPVFLLFIIIFFIIFYSIKLVLLLTKHNTPQQIVLNTVFNQIKSPVFEYATTSGGLKYTFDNIEGAPVTSTDSAKVFFLPVNRFQLGYVQKIYLMAKSMGFVTEEIKHELNEETKTASFNDRKQKLEVSILNYNFSYEYNLDAASGYFDQAATPEGEIAKQSAINYLSSFDRYPDELARGKTNVIFFNYNKDNKEMTILEENNGANMVEVDFYRADVPGIPTDFPIVSPSFHNSQDFVTMIFLKDGGYKVIRSQIKYFEKSNDQIGIYPVINGDEAFEKLKAGKGFIISHTNNESEDVLIKKMFFAYLDPDTYQEYMQPLYVFLGDNNFVAYVNALPDNYYVDYSQL